jgi:hypothetical protein
MLVLQNLRKKKSLAAAAVNCFFLNYPTHTRTCGSGIPSKLLSGR